MFGANNIVKTSDKEKWVYNDYVIAFDGVGIWNFGYDFIKNIVIFGVDNCSLSRTDNRKNNLLLLSEGPT